MLFLIYLAFSKFSQVKLGADDSIPEFNNITWWAKTLIAPNNCKLQVFNALCLWYRIWPVFLLCVWTNLPLHRLFLHLRKHPLLVNQTHRFVSHLWKQPAKIQQVKIDSLPTPACLIIAWLRRRWTLPFTTGELWIECHPLSLSIESRGLHGWVVYSLVGLLLALMAHR